MLNAFGITRKRGRDCFAKVPKKSANLFFVRGADYGVKLGERLNVFGLWLCLADGGTIRESVKKI